MPLNPILSNEQGNDLNGLSLDYYPFFLSTLYNNKDKSLINNIYLNQQLNDYYAKLGVNSWQNKGYSQINPYFSFGYNPSQNSNVELQYTSGQIPYYNLNYTKRF